MIEVILPLRVDPPCSDWDNRSTTTLDMAIWLEETVPGDYKWQVSFDDRLVVLLSNEESAIMFKLAFAHIWT